MVIGPPKKFIEFTILLFGYHDGIGIPVYYVLFVFILLRRNVPPLKFTELAILVT